MLDREELHSCYRIKIPGDIAGIPKLLLKYVNCALNKLKIKGERFSRNGCFITARSDGNLAARFQDRMH